MSNISRRDFLKTAGVMTLAVAAAGVLAGCDGKTPEVPEVTATSVTANNYTLSLKSVKNIAIKQYDADASKPTNELESENQYVIALLNVVAVDDSKVKATDATEVKFNLVTKTENMSESVAIGGSSGDLKLDYVQKLFGLEKNDTLTRLGSNANINGYALNSVKKGVGQYYYAAFKVDHPYNDQTALATPALTFAVHDADKMTYTKMEATIPAATDVTDDNENDKVFN